MDYEKSYEKVLERLKWWVDKLELQLLEINDMANPTLEESLKFDIVWYLRLKSEIAGIKLAIDFLEEEQD
jgi:hypothetical protein